MIEFNQIIQKFKNIIRIGFISIDSNDDSGDRHICTVSQYGRQIPSFAAYPYGMSANAPSSTSQALIFNIQDSQGVTACIPINQQKRFKDLKVGEAQFGNFITKSNTHYKENGDISITAPKGQSITFTVGAATLTLTPTALISSVPIQAPSFSGASGGIAVMTSGLDAGTNPITSKGVDLSSHVHSDPQGGTTGAPQ